MMNAIRINATLSDTGALLMSVLPQKEQKKKVTRTLGGQVFIQQIGSAVPMLGAEIAVNWNARLAFDDYVNNATALRIEWEGRYYIGFITDQELKWKMQNHAAQGNRYYTAKFDFHITSEGVMT